MSSGKSRGQTETPARVVASTLAFTLVRVVSGLLDRGADAADRGLTRAMAAGRRILGRGGPRSGSGRGV
ncbi:MAG TPA: hypothetical protein VKZ18_14545 [Polyangia bacterium]|nr:hypothetical protein [Polyangia bacterium]